MTRWIWTLALIGLVYAENVAKSEVKVVESQQPAISSSQNSTAENVKSEIPGTDKKKSVVALLSTLPVTGGDKSTGDSSDDMPGSALNPIQPEKYISPIDENGAFLKYNYVFLTIVSLSMVAFIVVKTHRMKQSRAEQKYGKAIDELEKEPFRNETSKNRWLEESSDDEDKDTLFDINFLKNSRTNAAHV